MDHDNTLEFEDLPTDEQNELTAAYEKNVHIHETQATKREYAKEKMPCNECGSLQLPNNMPRHKKTKLCQRARKDKLANKLDQKPQSADIEQVICAFLSQIQNVLRISLIFITDINQESVPVLPEIVSSKIHTASFNHMQTENPSTW